MKDCNRPYDCVRTKEIMSTLKTNPSMPIENRPNLVSLPVGTKKVCDVARAPRVLDSVVFFWQTVLFSSAAREDHSRVEASRRHEFILFLGGSD